MEAVRERWTDERLDDLNRKVDDGFRRMDERFAQVDARFDAMNNSINARFNAMQRDMNARFDAMQRLMLQVGGGLIGAFLTATVALVATQL